MTPLPTIMAIALVCWQTPEGRDCQRLEIAAETLADCQVKRREAASRVRATGADFLLGACARVYRQSAADTREPQ